MRVGGEDEYIEDFATFAKPEVATQAVDRLMEYVEEASEDAIELFSIFLENDETKDHTQHSFCFKGQIEPLDDAGEEIYVMYVGYL